jgi:hypothetical protein
MRLHVLLIVGFALSVTGCAEKQQAAPEPVDEVGITAPEAAAPAAENEKWRNDAFLAHMHLHAEKLDELNYALSDGNLDAAMKPAYWLSRHDTVSDDIQSDWLPYLYGMRTDAQAVEDAPDLATARAAAERITAQCQGCHAATGVTTE